MKLYWFLGKIKPKFPCKPITCTSSPDVSLGCAVDWSPIWEENLSLLCGEWYHPEGSHLNYSKWWPLICAFETKSARNLGDPPTHLFFHPSKVTSQSGVHIRGEHLKRWTWSNIQTLPFKTHLGEIESPWEKLAGCEGRDCVRICQVQFKVDLLWNILQI